MGGVYIPWATGAFGLLPRSLWVAKTSLENLQS
jgi:hypothetical protein